MRNTSVRALLSAILTHGTILTIKGWHQCMSDIVLPLLPALTTSTLQSSTTECDGAVLGVEKGQSIHMLVHHSRNSQMKQWEETLAIFVKELSRVIKTHLHIFFSKTSLRVFFLGTLCIITLSLSLLLWLSLTIYILISLIRSP